VAYGDLAFLSVF